MQRLKVGKGTIVLIEGDIVEQETEAIVNAANSGLMGGGGVDGAIHAAGGPSIIKECKEIINRIGRLEPGHAVLTTAGRMPSRFVIHTVGPVWRGGDRKEPEILCNCYLSSLKLAKEEGIRTISFPSISTGAYGYPLAEAARVAIMAVMGFLEKNDGIKEVIFVLWGKEAFETYSKVLDDISKIENRDKSRP